MSIFKEVNELENTFFELDETTGITTIYLQYDQTSDLFDSSFNTKQPMLTLDFQEKIKKSFKMIPYRHKLAFDISIKDPEGYTEDKLTQVFKDNLLLEFYSRQIEYGRKDRLAAWLILAGVISFILMMTLGNIFPDGGMLHDVFFYICDIATTVTIWEAMYILLIDSHENRFYNRSFVRRFRGIKLHMG